MNHYPDQYICLNNIKTPVLLGVTKAERCVPQDIILNLKIHIHAPNAHQTDYINDTLDYDALLQKIYCFIKEKQWCLLETLAHQITKIILENHFVLSVHLRIEKPNALKNLADVSLELYTKNS